MFLPLRTAELVLVPCAEGPGSEEGLQEGDTIVTNHPVAAGGSHLPDITVITPVWEAGSIVFFVASRGHHADVGGISPGSMPPHSKSLVEEGAIITSYKLVKDGVFQVRKFLVVHVRL
jgi:5-oxoprolinase (ATP-hydrolysing)